MPSPKAASGPLRFLTPGQMAICLVLFFLPWIELQCPMPKGGGLGGLKGGAGMPEPKLDAKDIVWSSFITQSGFQAATGGYSWADSMMKGMAEESGDSKGPDAAPLLWVYLIAVIGAVAAGFAMPSGTGRKTVLAGCCASALVIAGGQAAMGFPIAKVEGPAKNADKGGGKAMKMDMGLDSPFKVKYQIPFYLSLVLCVGGLITALIEPTGPAKPRGSRGHDGGGDGFVYADGGDGGGGDGGGGGD